jgi:hypothetical protein
LKKIRRTIDYSDSQAFTPALAHQNSLEFAALYTLHYGLPRNAEFGCGLDHGHVIWRRGRHDS